MKPHEHKDLIIQWANGAEVQVFDARNNKWQDEPYPDWYQTSQYRIKPEPIKDIVRYIRIGNGVLTYAPETQGHLDNLRLTFDGITGKLKSAEVL